MVGPWHQEVPDMSIPTAPRPICAGAGPIVDGHRISRGSADDIVATESLSRQQATEHGDELLRQEDGSHIIVNDHPVPQPEPIHLDETGASKFE